MKILGFDIEDDLTPKLRGAFTRQTDGRTTTEGGGLGLTMGQLAGQSAERAFGMDTPEARAFFAASDMSNGTSDIALTSKVEAFSRNTWVHKCVMKNAEMIAALPFMIRKGEKEIKNHPVIQLVRNPNPYFTESDLWQMTLAALNLYGEAFWLLNRDSYDGLTRAEGTPTGPTSFPKSIWPINPKQVEAVISTDHQKLLAWRVSYGGGARQEVDPLDVVHFRFPNIFNPWRGTSPLDAVALSVTSDQASMKYNLGVFARGAIPSGVLVAQGKLNPQQASEIVAKFEARHRESHRPAILHSGLDYKETQMSNHDMEFKELRRMNREDILAAFGVPPVAVGLLEHASYANADMQMKLYWTGTLIPQSDLLCNAIKKQLMFEEDYETLPLFDRSNVTELQTDTSKQLDVAKKFFELGYTTNQINERLQLGMPNNEWGDVAFLPFSLRPVEQIIDPPEPTALPTVTPVSGKVKKDDKKDTTDAEEATLVNDFSWGRVAASMNRIVLKGDMQRFIEAASIEDDAPPQETQALINVPMPTPKSADDVMALLESRVARTSAARAAAVSEKKLKKILQIIEKDKKALRGLAETYIQQATQEGITQINDMIGTGFSITDPDVVDFITNKVVLVSGIEDSTKAWIRETVAGGIADGLTVEEIADLIRDDYNLGPKRAYKIARTEVASSINGARFITMSKEGVKYHQWMSNRGPKVRDSHKKEHGGTVKLGEDFPVTGLAYPGEPDGPAEEVINCRCIAVPADADGKRTHSLDDDAYWTQIFGTRSQASTIEKKFGKAISKHFNAQRNSILKILLN